MLPTHVRDKFEELIRLVPPSADCRVRFEAQSYLFDEKENDEKKSN